MKAVYSCAYLVFIFFFLFHPGPPQPVQAAEEDEPGPRDGLPRERHPQRSLHTRVSVWLHHQQLHHVRLAHTHARTRHTHIHTHTRSLNATVNTGVLLTVVIITCSEEGRLIVSTQQLKVDQNTFQRHNGKFPACKQAFRSQGTSSREAQQSEEKTTNIYISV